MQLSEARGELNASHEAGHAIQHARHYAPL
jgi:Zn-dependent membrane protease YugP